MDIRKRFGFRAKSKDKIICGQDPDTGMIHCELREKLPDGSVSEPLAVADFRLDEQCRKIPVHLEGDDDSLAKLAKSANKYIKNECLANKPSDY